MFSMTKKSTVALALLTAFCTISYVQAQEKDSENVKYGVSRDDHQLIKKLAQANMAEIAAGELAQKHSKNHNIVSFAKHMVEDHTKALAEIRTLANQKHVSLPEQSDKLHQEKLSKLSKLDGLAFDKAYMRNSGLADHKSAKALVMKTSKNAKDKDLRALAAKMAPAIDMHLKMAQDFKFN